ncbi:hypothetical protein [Primorskyibacter sp. 2E233]|uniref:hypothetical protein n=1 Tax=Primorskyibacter sp. 2E233 TaxID=3413431 RepID=UPI003BF2DAC3
MNDVLTRVMRSWGYTWAGDLPPDLVCELDVLDRLLRAPPQEAGALAQHFVRPDLMLDLRDGVNEIAARRAIHDRNRNALETTQRLWTEQTNGASPSGLLPALQAMGVPDPDLWHRVILEHDKADSNQREAALWCIEQPACDRASIARYMADLVTSGRLVRAAQCGDIALLDRLRAVIEAVNDGKYPQAEIALSPRDAVAGEDQQFSMALAQLADLTGEARWPAPVGLFTDYPGRAPYPRDNWCLCSGALIAEPRAQDYFPDVPRAP